MKKGISIVVFLLSFLPLYSQDLTVPQEILDRLETKVVYTAHDTFTFRVAYPLTYEPTKTYDCFLGFSGGTQTMEIVNYCYAAWFQSGYFADYITLLPVNTDSDSTSFLDYKPKRIDRMLTAIQENFPLNSKWILGGTSNGGIGAFDILNRHPELFKAVILAPGVMEEDFVIQEDWSRIDFILAYGDKDKKEWIKNTKKTAKRLKSKAKSVRVVALKDQGHILPIRFNVDRIYDVYFLENKK